MNNVVVRALSGIVYIALIVGALIAGQPWLSILTAVFAGLAFVEFQSVTFRSEGSVKPAIRAIDTLFGVGFVLASGYGLMYATIGAITVFLCYPLVRLTLGLYDKSGGAFYTSALSALSLIYIALPLSVLNIMFDQLPRSSHMVLLMFIMIWLNDTGAFCVGSLCGRHRLFERLSPKKSWEGFFGGLAFCIIAGAAYALWYERAPLSVAEGIGMGVVVSVFSTWGDLFESLIKRTSGVKDSGHLIPGHGGILDRIDSLLFVAPATMIYWLALIF